MNHPYSFFPYFRGMERIVSGMRPTGNLHLGNYFGPMKTFLRLQEQEQCFFFIADYHSLTTHPHPMDLRRNVSSVLAQYLACGLDPEKCTLYVQSDVPETVELYMFLNMNAYVGELERVVSFKEKVRQHPDNVNAGLLTYPTLMAADILIHKATKVPVGKDQEQHLEMTRTFASRFNRIYEVEYFPEPTAHTEQKELVKIPGLDGSGKMGKSTGEANTVFLIDSPDQIRKKIMRAKTDSGPTTPDQDMPTEIQNLFLLMDLVSDADTVTHFRDAYAKCSIRYGDLKKQLAEDMIVALTPIRERIADFQNNDTLLERITKEGAEKARLSAQKTIKEVREIIGFKTL